MVASSITSATRSDRPHDVGHRWTHVVPSARHLDPYGHKLRKFGPSNLAAHVQTDQATLRRSARVHAKWLQTIRNSYPPVERTELTIREQPRHHDPQHDKYALLKRMASCPGDCTPQAQGLAVSECEERSR